MLSSTPHQSFDSQDFKSTLKATWTSFIDLVNQSAAKDTEHNLICRHVLTSLTRLIDRQYVLINELKAECENSPWIKRTVRKSNLSFFRVVFNPTSVHFDAGDIARDILSRTNNNNEIKENFLMIESNILVIRKDIPKNDKPAFTQATQELRALLASLQDQYKQLNLRLSNIYENAMQSLNQSQGKKSKIRPVDNLEPAKKQLGL